MFDRAVEFFGRTVVDPSPFDETAEGFQSFLDATGIQFFSAREMLRPNHADIATGLGYSLLLPGRDWWPRGAALASCADALRETVGEPVTMRNWWRPAPYNKAVGGAPGSDHVEAYAVDLDYRSSDSRRSAERRLREFDTQARWLDLSLGLGARTTHVGIGSSKGRRTWKYDSYQE